MKIQTKYQGEMEIEKKDIWNFANGIPGFPDEKEFVILSLPENEVYAILQSVKTPYLGFVIANPFLFFPDYSFDMDDAAVEQLQLKREKDVLIYSILTIQEPFEKTTANLQAPLIFNIQNRQAKQLILNEPHYKTKHIILQAKVAKG